MYPTKLEELAWRGECEFKTQTFGFGEQFFLNIEPETFVIVLGFDFSPRAFSTNSNNQPGDAGFLLQHVILSDESGADTFLYKPFFNILTKGSDTLYFTDLIQEDSLYLVYEKQLSIYTYITDLSNIVLGSDLTPTNNVLTPNITAGGKTVISNVDNVLSSENYAPLQQYGETIGFARSDERDLIIEKGSYTPVTTDPSNYPFITLRYALIKFQKPDTLL